MDSSPKIPWWKHPFVRRLVVIVALLVGMQLLKIPFKETPLFKAIEASSYGELQRHRIKMAPSPAVSEVVLIDLYPLIKPRETTRIDVSADTQQAMAARFVALRSLLEGLARARPRVVVVDWELVLPEPLRRTRAGKFAYHPALSEEFRTAYEELLRSLVKLHQQGVPVIIGGDYYESLRAKGEPATPISLHELTLCSLEVPYKYDKVVRESYVQEATGSKLPALTDALIRLLEDPRFPDRVAERPARYLLFEAVHRLSPAPEAKPTRALKAFWLDYGYAPHLLRNAFMFPTHADALSFQVALKYGMPFRPQEKAWAERLSELRGKIVMLADLSHSVTEQHPWPIAELAGKGHTVHLQQHAPGGLIHACAFLTRTQRPIYALPSDYRFMLISLAFNLALMFVVNKLSHFLAKFPRRRAISHDETRERIVHAAIESVFIILVAGGLIFFAPGLLARYDLFVPQYATIALTRFLDAALVVYELIAVLYCQSKQVN